MAAITAKFPGQHCVECGAEFTPGHSQIQVHPSIRGPKGGKKYVHANPGECGMRSNPFGRRNPLRELGGGRKRGSKYTQSYVAGSDAAKKLLDKHDAEVVVGLGTAAAWGAANRGGLVPFWADEDAEFYTGFIDTLPAVKAQARSMAQGFDSGDYMSRYNPAPRVFRNAGRRTFKGQPKAGRLERMGPVTGLPSMGTDAPYHDTDVRNMTKQQLVDSGAPWAAAELRRRGRDAQGVKMAWKK
jgi:hypothetical protein